MRPEDSGFRPNFYVNISEFLDEKIEIMNIYEGEVQEHPFPRSIDNIRALACLCLLPDALIQKHLCP